MELIHHLVSTHEESEASNVMQEHFSSMSRAMLTLCQFASGDGMFDVYWPLVMESWYLLLYFILVWLVVALMLMNLTTAVIVEQAITAGRKDRWTHQSQNRLKVEQFTP